MADPSESPIPVGAVWHIDDFTQAQSERWQEFFRIPSMSLGIYQLQAGETDPQLPHTEDEIYYIVRGKSKIQVEDAVYDCQPGSIIFVRKHAQHKFVDIQDDLTIVVFFAPAEGSLST
jgi:mannose-6-phosphate isomerase-like protein (cupin superfamily)